MSGCAAADCPTVRLTVTVKYKDQVVCQVHWLTVHIKP